MTTDETKAAILSDLRASFGELKCMGSERLVRLPLWVGMRPDEIERVIEATYSAVAIGAPGSL